MPDWEYFKFIIKTKKKAKKEKTGFYRCDPDRNTECSKSYCYRKYPDCCKHTHIKKYKMNIFKRIKEDIIWKLLKK